jgi:hypothetical protein
MITSIQLVLASTAIAIVALAALTYLGYGLGRLLLPKALSADPLVWLPILGYTLLTIVYHFVNVYWLDGRRTAVVLFGFATLLNLIGWRAGRVIPWPPSRIYAWVVAATFAAFVLSLVPLFAIGQLTAIGKNYDLTDVYDPEASYVLDYPVTSILAQSPPNPLIHTITSPVALSNGWGLTYFHAVTSVLTGQSPVETQTPVFGLMHALMLSTTFVFLRRAVGLSSWLALAISAGLAAHGLILSMLFIGLGNHIAILALLPLIFASTIRAIDYPNRRSITLAVFMLTNIPLTYWSAFAFYVPPVLVYAVIGRRLRWSKSAAEVANRLRLGLRGG